MSLLQLRQISKSFGSVTAVDRVDLQVEAGARHALIGPNGAGKTTLFRLIAGALPASGGRLFLDGVDVTGTSEDHRVRLGMARTFQHSTLVLGRSALDNVLLAVHRSTGIGSRMVPVFRREHRRRLHARCLELLDMVGLADRWAVPAGVLSHGERRQLEVATALGTRPRLLLLDEPAAGTSPAETARLTTLLRSLPTSITVLFVEHDLDLVFTVADTVTVLHLGQHLVTGSPEEIRADPRVQQVYLGGATDSADLFGTTDDGDRYPEEAIRHA